MIGRLGTLPTIAVISVIAIIVLLNVLVAWFHYNALVVLPPEHRRFPPVWMWLMIIPIVHTVFIWIISAFKLPASDRSALGEKAHRFGSCHQRLGLAAAIVTTTLFLPAVAILSFVADAETE
jgi:hypothetical protein